MFKTRRLTLRRLVLRPLTMRRLPAAAVVAALAIGPMLTACSSSTAASSKPTVVVSFYPLEYAVQRLVGDAATVEDLTPPGTEPHDLELSPRDVADVHDADLMVYVSGFQSAVDDAAGEAGDRALDLAGSVDLSRTDPEGELTHDPHFWLDPVRYAAAVRAVSARLQQALPASAAAIATAETALLADLTTLDAEFTAGLKTCAIRDLVTGHEAFGYLAQRYGLTQVGIAGLDPENEPDTATLAKVADLVRSRHITTVYTETLGSSAVTDTVAHETGARTAVLDPIEGLSAKSAARDYLGLMRADLATLRTGQVCS